MSPRLMNVVSHCQRSSLRLWCPAHFSSCRNVAIHLNVDISLKCNMAGVSSGESLLRAATRMAISSTTWLPTARVIFEDSCRKTGPDIRGHDNLSIGLHRGVEREETAKSRATDMDELRMRIARTIHRERCKEDESHYQVGLFKTVSH